VTRERAVVTIVDLTGVQVDGSSTVANLIDMMKAARLLGSRCVLSGVSHSLARDLVDLDLEALAIPVFATLRRALEYAMAQTLTRS
jgi:rsbT co-antagonist protein RsbR